MSIASRIESISNHLENTYDKLEDLGIDLQNTNKNLENLSINLDELYEEWPKVTEEGVSIELTNIRKGKMETQLKGNLYQNTSPNPNNPQDIQIVTGENQIYISGKNLFDEDLTRGSIGAGSSIRLRSTNQIKVESENNYTLNLSSTSKIQAIIYEYDSSDNRTQLTQSWNYLPYTFQTSSTTAKIRFVLRKDDDDTLLIEDVSKVQLEEGSDSTKYVPYVFHSCSINLGTLELCKNNTVEDYLYKLNNKWYKYNAIIKLIITGTENTWDTDNKDTVYGIQITNGLINANASSAMDIYSNRFVTDSLTNVRKTDHTSSFVLFGSANSNHLWFNKRGKTLEEFKTWLNSLGQTIVYFPAENPTSTEITDTTLINQLENLNNVKSSEDKTNISQTNNDLPFIINVTALMKNSD